MITSNALIRRADDEGVAARTVERDYVLAFVLVGMSEDPSAVSMVFKGGTALRACYFLDYRYSADLDFSLIDGMTVESGLDVVGRATQRARAVAGLSEATLDVGGAVPVIRYRGPLGGKRSIKINLQDDELVEDRAKLPLLRRYPDMPMDVAVVGYTETEIGAEKLRCVIQRSQCRDLYDLHYLLTRNRIQLAEAHDLFTRKARHRHLNPDRLPERLSTFIDDCEPRWEPELSEYVRNVPPYDQFRRELRREVRSILQ